MKEEKPTGFSFFLFILYNFFLEFFFVLIGYYTNFPYLATFIEFNLDNGRRRRRLEDGR